ncbi:dystroglycan [Trichonephila clavipes]|nr:dystroglycan [Trichonephila clavipes]
MAHHPHSSSKQLTFCVRTVSCIVLLFVSASCLVPSDDDETNYVNLLLRDLDSSGLQEQQPDKIVDGKDVVKRHWGISDATAVAGKVFSYPIPEDAFTGKIKRYEFSKLGDLFLGHQSNLDSACRSPCSRAVVPTRRRNMSHSSCHNDLLKDTFGDRLISRFGPVNWPPRSCDLTPLDYFLWGYVKSLVYADKPQTLDHLEDNIRRVITDIRPQMLEKVIENWTSRLDYIRASRGSPMPEIIFKMTATAGSNVVQSGRPIFDDFFQHLWPYIGNNTANAVFQMVKRLWLIRIDQ